MSFPRDGGLQSLVSDPLDQVFCCCEVFYSYEIFHFSRGLKVHVFFDFCNYFFII